MAVHCSQTASFPVWAFAAAIAVAMPGCGRIGNSGGAEAAPAQLLSVSPELLKVDVGRSDPVEASVTVENVGSKPVKLLSLTTTCGCTAPLPLKDGKLDPGESTKVSVRVSPLSYGSRKAALIVATNASGQPELRVPVEIKGPPLEPPYARDVPGEIAKRVTSAQTRLEVPLRFYCVESKGSPPWVKGCQTRAPGVTFSEPMVIREEVLDRGTVRRDYEISIVVESAPAVGDGLSGIIELDVRSPPTRVLPSIRLSVLNVPAVRCIPATIVVQGRVTKTFNVAVRSEDDSTFAVTGFDAENPGVSAEFEVGVKKELHLLKLSVDGAKHGATEESLRTLAAIRTTHPGAPVVTIPIVVDGNRGLLAE